jgi:hypothetical protein
MLIYSSNYRKYLQMRNELYYGILEHMYKKPFKPFEFPWGMRVYENDIPIYKIDYKKVLLKLV